jgi:hypothetical protein
VVEGGGGGIRAQSFVVNGCDFHGF